ncbi:ABC transporter permease [Candidatus Micrarchaeota archaeon]|nr:ABC transporter permease [Candidatus Micrarchaeota archaeon]
MASFGKLRALVGRDFLVIKRNALMLLFILLLPVAFSIIFASFKEVIPKSTPASVIKADANVSDADMRFATFTILSQFCSPTVDSREDAFRKLSREESYFIVSVPAGIREGKGNLTIYVDHSLSPLAEVSDYVVEILKYELGKVGLNPEITVEKMGRRIMPIEYFTPGVFMILLAIAGILIVPFNSMKDSDMMSRVLSSVNIWEFIASKLLFSLVIALIQIVILLATEYYLEMPVMGVNTASVLTAVLISFAFTSTGLFVAFALKLSNTARYICSLLFGVITAFSGALYPPGFLPSYLQPVPKILPTYYALVVLRGFAVKGTAESLLEDYIGIVVIWFILSLALFYYFVRRFRDG